MPRKGEPSVRERVKLGEAVNRMLEDGESQSAVLKFIRDKTGSDYTWWTVESWSRAAEVEATLPDEARESFGVDALTAIGRIPSVGGQRAAFASELVRDGVMTIRPIRRAVERWRARMT